MADSNENWAYHYEPSTVAASIVCAIFAISTILHLYQMIRTRAFYMIPLLIGCLIESVGFGARVASSIEAPNFTLGPYIVQALLILIAPALLAATVYMILGYIILTVNGEKHSMIRKRFLTKIFVLGDFFSFIVQSSGKCTKVMSISGRLYLAFKSDYSSSPAILVPRSHSQPY